MNEGGVQNDLPLRTIFMKERISRNKKSQNLQKAWSNWTSVTRSSDPVQQVTENAIASLVVSYS